MHNEAVLVKAWPLSQFWLSRVLIASGAGAGGRTDKSVPRGQLLSFEHVVPCLQDFPLTRTPGHYRFRLVTADIQGPLRGSGIGPWKTLL